MINSMKTKISKLKNNICIWIHDLFTPFDTISATIFLMFFLPLTSVIYFGNESSKVVNDNIIIGVISSSLVAIVIETQNNLKFNTRRHNELAEYFLELTLFKSALDRAEKKENDSDPLEKIWTYLPKLIRVLKGVNESKLEWLNSTEARTIQNILLINQEICFELGRYLEAEIDFYAIDSIYDKNVIGQTINNMPKEMVKELIRQKQREDIDKLVQELFFQDICANYDLTKKVYVINDFYVGKPSIDSIEKNVLSELCLEILHEIKILFPYLEYEEIYLRMKLIKENKNK